RLSTGQAQVPDRTMARAPMWPGERRTGHRRGGSCHGAPEAGRAGVVPAPWDTTPSVWGPGRAARGGGGGGGGASGGGRGGRGGATIWVVAGWLVAGCGWGGWGAAAALGQEGKGEPAPPPSRAPQGQPVPAEPTDQQLEELAPYEGRLIREVRLQQPVRDKD